MTLVTIDRDFLIRVMTRTKHGPAGSGRRGDCDPDCVKCEAQRLYDGSAGPDSAGSETGPADRGARRFDAVVESLNWSEEAT